MRFLRYIMHEVRVPHHCVQVIVGAMLFLTDVVSQMGLKMLKDNEQDLPSSLREVVDDSLTSSSMMLNVLNGPCRRKLHVTQGQTSWTCRRLRMATSTSKQRLRTLMITFEGLRKSSRSSRGIMVLAAPKRELTHVQVYRYRTYRLPLH